MRPPRLSGRLLTLLLLFGSLLATAPLSAAAAEPTESQLTEIGRRVYLEGLLADGTPSDAVVMGDVQVTGDHFTCVSCHRRSGLGGAEGTKFVLPTNGAALLAPRVDLYLSRPAYTLETFADAISAGVTPKGEHFDPIMPLYDLPALEMKGLFTYLKRLSYDFSPGFDDQTIHFATVVGPGVDPVQRDKMLTILDGFASNKNAQSRLEEKRKQNAPFFRDNKDRAFRRWEMHVWQLTGPADGWPQQLETYYNKQPVFALVSGMLAGPWQPVADFCRKQHLPCLLPNTDRPVVDASPDFYTLYFSKGMSLEAQVIASDLDDHPDRQRLVQIARPGGDGAAGRASLDELLKSEGKESITIDLTDDRSWDDLDAELARLKPDALMLWLDRTDLERFAKVAPQTPAALPTYLSSSLLDGELKAIPAPFKATGQVVHPFILPDEQAGRFIQASSWLKNNKIPLTDWRLQGQTFYACLLLNGGLRHIKSTFYREYMLDMLDHSDNMAVYSGTYPRLSFGPEQRFLAKGAYLVELASNKARWIVPGF